MAIRLSAITELATSLLGSHKFPYTTGALTRLIRFDTLADWVIQTYQGFTQSGSGAVAGDVSSFLDLLIHRAGYSSDAAFNTEFAAGRTNATLGISLTGGPVAKFFSTASSVNWMTFTGAVAGGSVKIGTDGTDTFVPLSLSAKGVDGYIIFRVNDTEEQLRIRRATTGVAVNRFELKGGATGAAPQWSVEGDDAVIDMLVYARGDNGAVRINDSLYVRRFTDVVNYVRIDGGTEAASRATISVQGESTNIQMDLTPKGTGGLRVVGTGSVYINDGSNAGMTTGLTINQGAADDSIVELKSSDVAHGVTTLMETDSFVRMLKSSATNGGLRLDAIRQANSGGALRARGISAGSDTTKTTSSIGQIDLEAAIISGTGITDCAANGALVAMRNNATTRWLVDAEGDTWQTGGVRVAQSGTAAASVADEVLFYSSDNTAGHTIPSFYCEGTEVIATGQADSASSVRVKMRINGTIVTLLAI